MMKSKRQFRTPQGLIVCFLAATCLIQSSSDAHQGTKVTDSTATRIVRPGVTHKQVVSSRGPWIVNILQIDLTQSELHIGAGRAFDRFFGREKTSSIAQRHNTADHVVIAALNADFFSLKTGEIENNNIIDGTFVKGTPMTGSPFDTFDNVHSQFAMTRNRKPLIDRFAFEGSITWSHGVTTGLTGINDLPRLQSLILYSDSYGPTTPTDTLNIPIREWPLTPAGTRFDTLLCVVSGESSTGGTPITTGSFVLSAYGRTEGSLTSFHKGDTVKVWTGLTPNRGPITTLVGGWPRLVLNGKNIAANADSLEGTFPRFSANRHPRSGVGFSQDSTKVYFIIVDGRSEKSVGMSLIEFGDLMIAEGIYQGMNLDGGGSTTLVINGTIVNSPTDPAGERPVGNCLLLFATKPK
jgi:hypothetical protein